MSEEYILRDEKGIMKARVPAQIVADFLVGDSAVRFDYRATDRATSCRAIRITDDVTLDMPVGRGQVLRLYFWKNDKLIPADY